MKRKIIALCVIVTMLATAIISSTLAYFTDTDSAVNVMTVGSVAIEQIEKERDDNGDLVAFTAGKMIMPAVYTDDSSLVPTKDLTTAGGTAKIYSDDVKNELDKIVYIENTGKSGAYVRTWFACELGELTIDEWKALIHVNKDETEWAWEETAGIQSIDVDGTAVNFVVMTATYTGTDGILAAGDTTLPSLIQVALDKTAKREDVNSLGDTYEILAYTQAIQAAGFDTAADAFAAEFGNTHPWTAGVDAPTMASSAADIASAISAGETSVILEAGEYTLPTMSGKTLAVKGDKDVVVEVVSNSGYQPYNGCSFEFDGITIMGTTTRGDNYKGLQHTESVVYRNCHLIGLQFLFAKDVVFENCTFETVANEEHCIWTYGATNITFTDCEFTYGDRCVNVYADQGTEQYVTFKNCTFNTTNTASEGAVEINSCFFTDGIEVTLEGCTAPAYGEMAYISPWDSLNGANTTLTIK